jgi:hypothetical protein
MQTSVNDPSISYFLHRFLKNMCSAPAPYTEPDGTIKADPLAYLEMLDPTWGLILMDDFTKYDVGQATSYYTFTDDGGDCVDTIVGPTGVLVLTTAGNDDDFGQLFLTNAPFQLQAGKKAGFETKFKINTSQQTIGQEEFVVGLTSPTAEAAAAFMDAGGTVRTFDDGVAFVSYDGSTDVDAIMGENDVFGNDDGVATYADNTWMTLSIYFDGVAANFYKDDVWLGRLYNTMPTSVVTPMFFFREGEAHARVISIDYWIAACER